MNQDQFKVLMEVKSLLELEKLLKERTLAKGDSSLVPLSRDIFLELHKRLDFLGYTLNQT